MQIQLTKGVKWILISCFAAFVVQQTSDQFFDGNLLNWFALVPSGFMIGHRVWQIITYSFLHADVMHLFLNMLMLAFFAPELEARWGTPRFLRYYFVCAMGAGIVYLMMQVFFLSGGGGQALQTPMVGASGAIYGVLLAYGIIFSERTLAFMMLFPMKAKHFIWLMALVELMATVYSSRSPLSGLAHLGGMATGFVFLWGQAVFIVMKKRQKENQGAGRGQKPSTKKRSEHLRLIVNKDGRNDPPNDPHDDSKPPRIWH